ncbi:hypothetical protein PGT21_030426 [Puccinia graminis f. sp. tritici]|uniref:Uncharacterized protein n=1 Tax=Puccinia graminis f. sp. tritici TaxID=56615 RepID=A0A5B0M110_PUCGR|nr:hypothetical protein PGT21_030426 [Puccinia graminis f. sp. tritici]
MIDGTTPVELEGNLPSRSLTASTPANKEDTKISKVRSSEGKGHVTPHLIDLLSFIFFLISNSQSSTLHHHPRSNSPPHSLHIDRIPLAPADFALNCWFDTR